VVPFEKKSSHGKEDPTVFVRSIPAAPSNDTFNLPLTSKRVVGALQPMPTFPVVNILDTLTAKELNTVVLTPEAIKVFV
jgi:hypothetical protein